MAEAIMLAANLAGRPQFCKPLRQFFRVAGYPQTRELPQTSSNDPRKLREYLFEKVLLF